MADEKFEEVINALPAEGKAELDLEDHRRTHTIGETELTVAQWRLS